MSYYIKTVDQIVEGHFISMNWLSPSSPLSTIAVEIQKEKGSLDEHERSAAIQQVNKFCQTKIKE